MNCGGMPFADVTDLSSKTIKQVNTCIDRSCGDYANDLTAMGEKYYNYFLNCYDGDNSCRECKEIITNLDEDLPYPSEECEDCFNGCAADYRDVETSFEAIFGCHMTCGNMTSTKVAYDVNDYTDCMGSVCKDSYNAVINDPTSSAILDDFKNCQGNSTTCSLCLLIIEST